MLTNSTASEIPVGWAKASHWPRRHGRHWRKNSSRPRRRFGRRPTASARRSAQSRVIPRSTSGNGAITMSHTDDLSTGRTAMTHVNRRAFMAASAASAVAPHLARAQAPNTNSMIWATMSQAARDAAYNNGAAVSDSSQIAERWVAASTAFRGERSQHIDLAYGPGERNKWDLFPGNDPKAPCLVHIHGGYWLLGQPA